MSPADVSASDPVHLEVLGEVVLPGEEVVVSLVLGVLDPVGAVPGVGQAEGPSPVTEALSQPTGGEAQEGEEEIFHLKTTKLGKFSSSVYSHEVWGIY